MTESVQESTHLALAVGGVIFVAWFGLRNLRLPRHPGRRRLPTDSPEYREAAHLAWLAEFEELPPALLHEPTGRFDQMGGTVHCRSCGEQFPAGTIYCPECCGETSELEEHADLREKPISEEDRSRLICVHVAESPMRATILKGFFESHGVPCLTIGHVPTSVYSFAITPLSEVRILVRQMDATKARHLLSECR